MSQNLSLPYGTKIKFLEFPCNEVVNNHGEFCDRPVYVDTANLSIEEIQDLLDQDILDRCSDCRDKHQTKIAAQDAAQH